MSHKDNLVFSSDVVKRNAEKWYKQSVGNLAAIVTFLGAGASGTLTYFLIMARRYNELMMLAGMIVVTLWIIAGQDD